MKNIIEIGKKLGLNSNDLELYGTNKAKIISNPVSSSHSKLVLVTAINPTRYGEGKTTVSIGLTDAFSNNKVSAPSIFKSFASTTLSSFV